ncbi:hypothetical protein BDV96DRAFT_612317 [Lophiotrema nucula]|uniref:Galactose oxidase n=1 Tax=Lophiotrema nucula TaxID=690887 RepID=A0A6A5Z9M9_9PLEO|nr:hypothetical protein BDV96DRAFT_612317 [Lophiotrema nucula]
MSHHSAAFGLMQENSNNTAKAQSKGPFEVPRIADVWVQHIPIAPRQENTAVFLPPDNIAIIGGIATKGNTTATTDLVQLYFDRGKSMEYSVADGKIFILGGLAETATAWNAAPASRVDNPGTDVWEELDDMPDARGSAAVGAWEGKIILAGGLKQIQLVSPYAQDTVATVSIYDIKARICTEAPEMPDARDHAGAAIVDGKFYVLGGRTNASIRCKNTTLVLDLGDFNAGWTTLETRMPTARSGLSVGAVGTKIYTFGGEGNLEVDSGVFNQTEAYDVETGHWATLEQMEVPRHGTAGVSAAGKIYIPGGGEVIGIGPSSYFDGFAVLG